MARRNGRVRLQADDDLILAVDPAGLMGKDAGGRRCIDVQHPLALLFLEKWLQLGPDRPRAVGRPGKEGFIAFVGCEIANNEVAHVDRLHPATTLEPAPASLVPGVARTNVDAFHFPFLPGLAAQDQSDPECGGTVSLCSFGAGDDACFSSKNSGKILRVRSDDQVQHVGADRHDRRRRRPASVRRDQSADHLQVPPASGSRRALPAS